MRESCDRAARPGDTGETAVGHNRHPRRRWEMLYTYCPKCGVRTDWALTCSACGAPIPLFGADERLKASAAISEYLAQTQVKESAEGERDSPLLPVVIGLGAVAVIVLGMTLFP